MHPHLVVAHYHLRPGGVRRVMETALPEIVVLGGFSEVTLATGEAPDPEWLDRLKASLQGVPLRLRLHRELSYWSELGGEERMCGERLVRLCVDILSVPGEGCSVLWAHNLALGRNAPLAEAWARAALATGAVFLSQHHDFFFDNRWARWPEIVECGYGNLRSAAEAMISVGGRTVHLAINRADHALLSAGFGQRAIWLPNPIAGFRGSGDGAAAHSWLARRSGREAPFWLLPCRMHRRKNIAEAVLLTRWLRPGMRVVTTGAVTSADEQNYGERLAREALRGGWPVDFSVLAGTARAPRVEDLFAGAEVVMLTSMQEGFGLPVLEAAAACRPLVARFLPNVTPDFLSLGLRMPVVYEDLEVPLDLFGAGDEKERQGRLWEAWRAGLPPEAREKVEEPALLSDAPRGVVPFSRLTVTGQLDVLSRSAADVHAGLDEANPVLAAWAELADRLPPTEIGEEGLHRLSTSSFAEGFLAAIDRAVASPPVAEDTPWTVMRGFLSDRLRANKLYPALFTSET